MSPVEIISTLRNADLLLSGGGSLFQDVTSAGSMAYYLGLIWLAKRMGKKVMVYAQGVGPINHKACRRAARRVLDRVDLITVRDAASKQYLIELGVKRPDIKVTADASFAIQPAPSEEAQSILTAAGAPEDVPLIGVALRPWQEQAKWLPSIACGLDAAAARVGAALVFLPMQRDQDLAVAVRVAAEMSAPSVVISNQIGPAQALAVIGRMSLVVGMRLHALIFGASMDVPFVGISYDPKVEAFIQEATGHAPLRLDLLSAADVTARVIDAWEHKADYAGQIRARVQRYKSAALENAELACRLIEA